MADEFGLTAENAPRFTAFATTRDRLDWHLEGEHRPMFAFWKAKDHWILFFTAAGRPGVRIEQFVCASQLQTQRNWCAPTANSFEIAKKLGCATMNIDTVEENMVLRNWYETFGFAHIGTEKFDFFPFTCGYMKKNL